MHLSLQKIPTLHFNNTFVLSLATNPIRNSKLNHIKVDISFTGEKVKQCEIQLH